MLLRDGGIWEFFLPGAAEGHTYKYNVRSRLRAYRQQKADPYAFYCETPPKSASVVVDLNKYQWGDAGWMSERASKDWLHEPVSIYEVHLESWPRSQLSRMSRGTCSHSCPSAAGASPLPTCASRRSFRSGLARAAVTA